MKVRVGLLVGAGAVVIAVIAGAARAQPPSGLVVHSLFAGTLGPPVSRPATEPDLEPGFPVQTYEHEGSYHGGPANHVLVGNIDADPTLEILASAHAIGPLYAWNSDGSSEPGWPHSGFPGAQYPALGQLSSDPGLEVFSSSWGGEFNAYNGSGASLPGWPRPESNYVDTPPALGDVNNDGLDEIFTEEQDWSLHAYTAAGAILAGWPRMCDGGQEMHTPRSPTSTGTASPRSSPRPARRRRASTCARGTAMARRSPAFPSCSTTATGRPTPSR